MKPYRKHRWEYIGAEPSIHLNMNQRHFSAYERCKDCCVTKTSQTKDEWCGNPRDDKFASFPYPKVAGEYDSVSGGR